MTSKVYSRKWRPTIFSDLVGQDHIASVLKNALVRKRLSHAYLFCGPRGTGKTTTARILAKAANCISISNGDPCNTCTTCITANENKSLDIIELDAASNRGIDEIRDIREKVNFSPVEGQYKIYIIDEAHMLTDQASNAFLKTLEEPPQHVIFVLCTTESHKILPTIISRCQRHDFRRLQNEAVIGQLANIADLEGVTIESEALQIITRQASGSLRDAENLLEQVVVSYGDSVTSNQVNEILGVIDADIMLDLALAILGKQTVESLNLINQASWEGVDTKRIHSETTKFLRAAMLIEWGVTETMDFPSHIVDGISAAVNNTSSSSISSALRTWTEAEVRYDTSSTLPLELAVIHICGSESTLATAEYPTQNESIEETHYPITSQESITQPISQEHNQEPKLSEPQAPLREMPDDTEGKDHELPTTETIDSDQLTNNLATPSSEVKPSISFESQWAEALKILSRSKGNKYNLSALLRDCIPTDITISEDTLTLPFRNQANLDRMIEEMEDPNSRKTVQEAFDQCLGKAFTLELILSEDPSAHSPDRTIQNSPLVRAALGMGARIIEETQE